MSSSRRQFLLRTIAAGSVSVLRPVRAGEAQPPNAFEYKRNWSRWGKDDQKGAVNLITPAKRAAAAALVRTGRTVSLSPPFTPNQPVRGEELEPLLRRRRAIRVHAGRAAAEGAACDRQPGQSDRDVLTREPE